MRRARRMGDGSARRAGRCAAQSRPPTAVPPLTGCFTANGLFHRLPAANRQPRYNPSAATPGSVIAPPASRPRPVGRHRSRGLPSWQTLCTHRAPRNAQTCAKRAGYPLELRLLPSHTSGEGATPAYIPPNGDRPLDRGRVVGRGAAGRLVNGAGWAAGSAGRAAGRRNRPGQLRRKEATTGRWSEAGVTGTAAVVGRRPALCNWKSMRLVGLPASIV
jgi:hypothetical protein